MKLMDLILGRTNNWNRVPEHTTSEAVLILSKALLLDAQELTDSVAEYADESAYSKGNRWYANILTTALGGILDECQALSDTPLGDRKMLDALALARAQLEEAGKNYSR